MVYRFGLSASRPPAGTNHCSAKVNRFARALEISIKVQSNREGTIPVLLKIGVDDFPAILKEFASAFPEYAGLIRLCTSIVSKNNLDWLEEPRSVQHDEKARARDLLSDLEVIQTFISELYDQAPDGEKENVDKIWERLQKVMRSLRLVG